MTRASMDGPHDPDCPCGWCQWKCSASTSYDPLKPPGPFSLPVTLCPACGHGIDPHGLDPGGPCGVAYFDDAEGKYVLCACLWSPNDIAAIWRQAEAEEEKARADFAITLWEQEANGIQRVTTERIVAALQEELVTAHRVFYDDDPYGSTVVHGEQQVRDDAAAIARKAGLADD